MNSNVKQIRYGFFWNHNNTDRMYGILGQHMVVHKSGRCLYENISNSRWYDNYSPTVDGYCIRDPNYKKAK